ncbi:hypothetical protein [uncultured Sulfitobacter sp.]|uniref:hypothetical protein n=1 Tax=uncultured Sulfitobacter sp. TaxID=191468 RepID=UPI00261E151E|nr:hypothetical protein [uncultured Sulfitobacter sp.]
MIIIFDHLDPADLKKARRSVLAASIATLIFATLQISEDSHIEFLEFTLQISQNKIVKLGQVAALILLVIFFLKMIPNAIVAIKAAWLNRLKSIDQHESMTLQYSWGWDESEDFGDDPQGEIKALESKQKYRRTKSERFFDRNLALTNTVIALVMDVSLPIVFALFAVCNPYFLAQSIQTNDKQLFLLKSQQDEIIALDEDNEALGDRLPPLESENGG